MKLPLLALGLMVVCLGTTGRRLSAAEKDLPANPGGNQPLQTQLAERAWSARQRASQCEAELLAAEKELQAKAAKAKTVREKAAAAAKASKAAADEQQAAEKALEAASAEEKAEAQRRRDEKSLAAQKASAAADELNRAAAKALDEKSAAEKTRAAKEAPLTQALDAAALAHCEALGGLKPITSQDWTYARARHLLFRAGFGGPPEEVQKLLEMGPHRAVAYLVEYHRQPPANIEIESDIYSWERPLAYETRLSAGAQNQISDHDGKRNVDSHAALVRWWVRRLLESPRPLEEKLVLFWHGHFASSYRTLGDTYLMYQQNQLFRRYADNYDALLHGVVQDPAIIKYLNNDENVAGHTNENLGRELLELFSLGEENCAAHRPDGYTEKDVRDGNTRALTGAGYEKYSAQYRFYHAQHDTGVKTLLGQTGNWGTHEAVDVMLQHPGTARYLAKKLWQYFAYQDPESQVVDRLAHVLQENGYRLRPALANLFLSEEFYSDRALGGHIKSPVELLVGTAKVVKLPKLTYQNVRFLLAATGQSLFDPPSVAGWPGDTDWVNTNLLMARYTATANLVNEGKPDLVALLKDQKLAGPAEVVDHLARRCLLVDLTQDKRQQLIDFLGPLAPSAEWTRQHDHVNAKLQALLLLLVSMPEYQVS